MGSIVSVLLVVGFVYGIACAPFGVLAINRDPDADIFDQADVGIVGEWQAVVARLCDALRTRRSGDVTARELI
jgi:electron transfer flavoprotein alpha subunit